MQREILNYYSQVNAQNLHAKGEIASRLLMERLNCQAGEQVLEIGFGTGATLIQLYSRHPKTRFYGIESSKRMFEKAKARLRFSLLDNRIQLFLIEPKAPFPFETHSFDKVYLESVLAIQEGEDLRGLLMEIGRILRPGGILLMNETLWLDTTPLREIHRINAACKRDFGIIQSNAAYPYLKDWQTLLTDSGFQVESVTPLGNIRADFKWPTRFPFGFLSSIFSAIGKIKAVVHPALRKARRQYKRNMKKINPPQTPLMEGVFIIARNRI